MIIFWIADSLRIFLADGRIRGRDNDCSVDLNPNPTHPRGSAESMESNDSDENMFDFKSNQVNEHGETLITLPCKDSAPEIEQQEEVEPPKESTGQQ